MSLFGSRSKQRASAPLVITTVASTRKRKAAEQTGPDPSPAPKRFTPVGPSTPSASPAMSSDDEFMSDQMSDDAYGDDDEDSLGELGMQRLHVSPAMSS